MSDVIRGLQFCVNSSTEIMEQHHLATMDKYIDPKTQAPLTKRFVIRDGYAIDVPLICLSDHHSFYLDEMDVKLSVRLKDIDIKETAAPLSGDGSKFSIDRSSFLVELAGAVPDKDATIDVNFKFKSTPPPEALAHFVKDVGIDGKGQVRMVTFNYQENVLGADGKIETQDRHIEAPFLALTGIPNLAIEDVHISFDLEVSTAEDDEKKNQEDAQVETSHKSWWSPVSAKFTGNVTHSSSQTRHTDTRAKYTFNVSARKQDAPEGFMRILDAITNQCRYPPPGNQAGQSSSQREKSRYMFW